MKKVIKTIFIFIIYISSISLFYYEINIKHEKSREVDKSAIIENYNISVNINENNTYDIHEIVNKNYLKEDKNFTKKISTKNRYTRLDGKKNNWGVKIKNFDFKNLISNNICYLTIKDNNWKNGLCEYDFNYTYDVGKDKVKNYDEFYYNLVGDYLDKEVKNLNFELKFPKDIDSENLSIYIEKDGDKDLENVYYEVEENIVKGNILRDLEPYEKVIVRAKLPDNYFYGAGEKFELNDVLFLGIPIIGAIIAIVYLSKYRKNKKAKNIRFPYPPKDLSIIEIATLSDKELYSKDIINIIINLANKGYLKIIEKEDNSFEIIRLRDYEENNKYEKLFFNKLFEEKMIIKKSDLKDRMYKTLGNISEKAEDFLKNKNIYFAKNKKISKILYTLMIVSIFLIYYIPAKKYGILNTPLGLLYFFKRYTPEITTNISFTLLGFYLLTIAHKKRILNTIIMFFTLPVIMITAGDIKTQMLLYEPRYFYGFILGVISVLVIALCIRVIKRKVYIKDNSLEKVEGFKEFLKTATKEELENLVLENPNYFYDMLPYANIFEITRIWLNKFKDINIKEADWFDSNKDKSITNFIYSVYPKIVNIMFK